ncbi:DUF72 domain-containing protein [soil metagenome]
MTVFVGTSGWQYEDWRQRFYPKEVAQRRWLEHYAERFATVESNAAFYRLPAPDTFSAWAQRTPADFVMAVKASRYLTHIKRLSEPSEPVDRLLGHARGLGDKLGPVLLQLPPTLRADQTALGQTIEAFAGRARLAVEFRHESWFTPEVRRLLEEGGVALCLADRGSRPVTPVWRTASWTYLRFHAGRASPAPCYGRSALASWLERLESEWDKEDDVYVYFNNDHRACALRDAALFGRAAERVGWPVTRLPRHAVQVG